MMASKEDQSSAVRSTGKVNWFSDSKGYGFITPDDDGEELFVHQSSIISEGFRSLTIGDSVEFAVTQGNDDKTRAVDVTAPGGRPLKKKDNKDRGRRGGGCFNCGEVGHMAKDCGGGGGGEGRERGVGGEGCYNCGDTGHFAKDCVQKSASRNVRTGGGSGGESCCFSCGGVGHVARDCSGGVGSCYSCGGFGHMARDCATKRQPSRACYECGGSGHLARDCERRGSGGGGGGGGGGNSKCFNCGEEGHFARECSVA